MVGRMSSSLAFRTCSGCGLDGFACSSHDGRWGETELTEQRHGVSGRAEMVNADDAPCVPDEVSPAQGYACLDTDPGADLCRQDLVAVILVAGFEPLTAGHRHYSGRNPL